MGETWKKIISVFLSILLFLCGCSKTKPDTDLSISAPKKIIWGIVKYNPYIKTINPDSEVMKYICKKFNCNIEFRYYDSFNTKIIKQMLTSDTFPHLLTMETMSLEGQFLSTNDAVLSFNKLIGNSKHSVPQETIEILSEANDTLYGIPGRFATDSQLKNNVFPQGEGIYVAQPYYNLLGRPKINSINDILSVSNIFSKQYKDLRTNVDSHYYDIEESTEIYPVILGDSGNGIETLKHLFSIYPVFSSEDEVYHSISSPYWKNLIEWLNSLSRLSTKSMSLSGNILKSALNGKNLFYIGSAPCINDTNFQQDFFKYELLKLNNSGFPFSINPYGNCQTYILKNKDSTETVKQLVTYLLSDEGNLLVKYGIENKHWIPTGDSALQLEWVVDKMNEDKYDFINSSGIGQLLFLTNLENDNQNTPDYLVSEKSPFFTSVLNFTAGTNDAIKLQKLNDYEISLCQKAASIDEIKHPQKLSVIVSDLNYFPLYAKQYKFDSLEARYIYWSSLKLKGTIM